MGEDKITHCQISPWGTTSEHQVGFHPTASPVPCTHREKEKARQKSGNTWHNTLPWVAVTNWGSCWHFPIRTLDSSLNLRSFLNLLEGIGWEGCRTHPTPLRLPPQAAGLYVIIFQYFGDKNLLKKQQKTPTYTENPQTNKQIKIKN